MTIEQFWTILAKHWKLVLICFLCLGAGAFLGSKLIKPLYQSSALVQVAIRSNSNNSQADYNSLMASDQLVQTEATLATSAPVLSAVASQYPGLSVSQLAGEVSTTPKSNTQLFEIDVLDASPSMATSLANAIAATLIQQQQQIIQQQNAQAQNQIQHNIDQTNFQIKNTTTKIYALQVKGGNREQIALLQVQLSGLQQQYNQWQNALAQLETSQMQDSNPLQLAQSAQLPTSPVQPNVRLNTIGGLLVGLLLGLVLAVLYESLNVRVRSPEELTQLLACPSLATIWRVNAANAAEIINPTSPDINIEPYRILRTNIGFSSIDKPLRSLVVVSAIPGEGKSVISANLAIYMAKTGKVTLLIDADFRRPTQNALFHLPPTKLGLSNAIAKLSTSNVSRPTSLHQFVSIPSLLHSQNGATSPPFSLESYAHTVGIPNLLVMPTGPMLPNPPEWFDSNVLQGFLQMLPQYGIDMVIFDTPPLLGLSDASILASKVDGALIVIDTTRATKGKLKQVKAILSRTDVNVLGCVANKVKRKRSDQNFYYDYRPEHQDEAEIPISNGQLPSPPLSPPMLEPPTSSPLQFGHNTGW